jgi:2-oxoisovalerate dehydrogenase E1 component
MTPIAAGLALSQKWRKQREVTVVFIGDGTLGEGILYEALNVSSKWNLPVIVVVENNLYSQSTSQHETLSGDICARAEAFGIRTACADTWNFANLVATAKEAVDYVRSEERPFLLRIDTYRLMAHSKGDDNRDKQEIRSRFSRRTIPTRLWRSSRRSRPGSMPPYRPPWRRLIRSNVRATMTMIRRARSNGRP